MNEQNVGKLSYPFMPSEAYLMYKTKELLEYSVILYALLRSSNPVRWLVSLTRNVCPSDLLLSQQSERSVRSIRVLTGTP